MIVQHQDGELLAMSTHANTSILLHPNSKMLVMIKIPGFYGEGSLPCGQPITFVDCNSTLIAAAPDSHLLLWSVDQEKPVVHEILSVPNYVIWAITT